MVVARFFRLVGHDFLDFFGDWWSCCGGWVDNGSGFGVLVAAWRFVLDLASRFDLYWISVGGFLFFSLFGR